MVGASLNQAPGRTVIYADVLPQQGDRDIKRLGEKVVPVNLAVGLFVVLLSLRSGPS
jgi:hypothetical protein